MHPSDYFTGFNKFNENHLPPPQVIFNKLTGDAISDEEYPHAQSVWNEFNINTLGDYHDLYVKTVLLLADVFQNIRSQSNKYYDIDPCHVYTFPGLSFFTIYEFIESRYLTKNYNYKHLLKYS